MISAKKFMIRRLRYFSTSAQRGAQLGPKLTPEEESHLKILSTRITSDGYCDIPPRVAQLCIFPDKNLYRPARYAPGIFDGIQWMLFRRHQSTARFTDMTSERLNDAVLMDKFGLDPTRFNHQLYWLTIHSWMLHQRFLVEKLSKLESDYVDRIWLLPYKWMMDKGMARHRLQVELEHAHRHSLKFCVDMDQAISRADILPGQMSEVLWKTIYAEDPKVRSASDPRVTRLTKYIIRNLNYVLNSVPSQHFVQAAFKWPNDN